MLLDETLEGFGLASKVRGLCAASLRSERSWPARDRSGGLSEDAAGGFFRRPAQRAGDRRAVRRFDRHHASSCIMS